jgi:non-heme chloroperoxidase
LWSDEGALELAADSWGPTDGRFVALLHGSGQSRHAWSQTGARLARAGYHAVAFDFRGHGDSAWDPSGFYDDAGRLDDLRRVVAMFHADKPILIGASMGGGTALLAVGEGRVDASALVLVDIAPRVETGGTDEIAKFLERYRGGFGSLEEFAGAIGEYQPGRRPPRPERLAIHLRRGADERYYWHWDPDILNTDLGDPERTLRVEAAAAKIAVPTLLLRGERSQILSEDGVRSFLALCPHAEYVEVPGAGHTGAYDGNEAFAAAVLEFLGRHAPTHGVPAEADGSGS